ncbi:MAG: PEP-CTERM sorting domain-containing protein [Methylococcaceae bacterium]
MKKILLIIALFTSFSINASTIVFSNNLIIEQTSMTISSHDPHGGSYEDYFGIKATFNDTEYSGMMSHGAYVFSSGGSQNLDSVAIETKFLSIGFGDENYSWSLSGETTREVIYDSPLGISDIENFEFKFYDYPTPFANGNLNPEPTTIENITIIPVAETPVPSAIWLFGTGLVGLFKLRRQN